MGLQVRVATGVDVARIIDGLLIAADAVPDCPLLAKEFVRLADLFDDALDRLPASSDLQVRTALARRHIREYLVSTEVLVNGIPRAKAEAMHP